MKKSIFISLMLFIGAAYLFGQMPVVKTPEPSKISPIIVGGNNYSNPNQRSNIPNFPHTPNPNNPMEMYEGDGMEVERRNMEMQQMMFEQEAFGNTAPSDFPSLMGLPDTEYYQEAKEILVGMLNGTIPLNLKDAIFLVENAYFGGRLDYKQYKKAIQNMARIAEQKSFEDGYNWKDPLTKNLMLFRVMSDTLSIRNPMQENYVTSYPMEYDFEDYWAKEDFSNFFVTKLLATHTGQCHSMPLLYLILCEETGGEASLAFAPAHCYVKFEDKSGNWHNLELTRGWITSDAFIIASGYITAEAIKNGVYMAPQTKEQTIAHCLSDLAYGYGRKYGCDPFVKECLDIALQYAPYNYSALRNKANYQTYFFDYAAKLAGRPPIESIKETHPHLYELREERNKTYQLIDNIGLNDMPKELYDKWLHSLDEEIEQYKLKEKSHPVIRLLK